MICSDSEKNKKFVENSRAFATVDVIKMSSSKELHH
jgi:hypothetical protein